MGKCRLLIMLALMALLSTAAMGCAGPEDAGEESAPAAQAQRVLQPFTAEQLEGLPVEVAKDSFAPDAVNLLAELPEDEIYLYSRLEDGENGDENPVVWLRRQDAFAEFNWHYSTPRGVLPRMVCYDADDDGTDELAVILYTGSGTGIAIEELHMVEFAADGTLIDYCLPAELYAVDLAEKIGLEVNSEKVILTLDGQPAQVPLADLPLKDLPGEENAALIGDAVSLGNIVYFSAENDALQARWGVGIRYADYADVVYFPYELHAVVTYRDGAFAFSDFDWRLPE